MGDGKLWPIGFSFGIGSLWQWGFAPLVLERWQAKKDAKYVPFLGRVREFIRDCPRFEDGLLYRKGKGAMTDDPYMTVPFFVREGRFDEAIAQGLGTHARLLDAEKRLLGHLWGVKTHRPAGELCGLGDGGWGLAPVWLNMR